MIKFLITSILIVTPLVSGSIAAKQFEVAFSPRMGARQLIITTIDNAKQSIYVAAYSFTSTAIVDALEKAQQRGVDVKIVLDQKRTLERGSVYNSLKNKKIPFRVNNNYPIMHNKFMIIDAETIQVGSFNYTKVAEKSNAENVLVINKCPELAQQYLTEWQRLWSESSQ